MDLHAPCTLPIKTGGISLFRENGHTQTIHAQCRRKHPLLGFVRVPIKRCLSTRYQHKEQSSLLDRPEASGRAQEGIWSRFISLRPLSGVRAQLQLLPEGVAWQEIWS